MNSTPQETVIALLEDKVLVELHREKNNTQHSVGDIFLGRVRKVMPGLNAAFVDVGADKEGFLHFLDLGPQVQALHKFTNCALHGDQAQLDISEYKLKEELSKTAKISSVLKQNQFVLVQVTKEPISTKGPRLSSEISFAGRYVVLIPFSNRISISSKIKNPDERQRLKNLVQSVRPKNFGVIIRTVAEGKTAAELHSDLDSLFRKWDQIKSHLHNITPPVKVCSEMDKTVSLLRDFLSNDFDQIVTNSEEIYEEIRAYVETIAPDKKNIVKYYKDREPIFDHYGERKIHDKSDRPALILEKLSENKPCLVARMGSGELGILEHYIRNPNIRHFPKGPARGISVCCGFFPNDDAHLLEFCKVYSEALKQVDIMGVWFNNYEREAVDKYCPKAELCTLESMDFVHGAEGFWGKYLKGKKVLVFHKKRRKGYRKLNGHRQQFTEILVKEVVA